MNKIQHTRKIQKNQIENENDSQYDDCRNIDFDEKDKYINIKISQQPN